MLQVNVATTPSRRIHHLQLAIRPPIPPAPQPVDPTESKKKDVGGNAGKGAIRPPQPLAKPPKKQKPGGGQL
jgi:hypothetical protein